MTRGVSVDRRSLLVGAGVAAALDALPLPVRAQPASAEKADYTLKIATGMVELSPEHIISTTLYNEQFPGPLLRLREGKPVTVDVVNETDVPELVHWHGQMIASEVDGASEEGTPFVQPHATRRIAFTPNQLVSASCTRMCPRMAIWVAAPTPGRQRRSISNPPTTPAPMTRKFSSS